MINPLRQATVLQMGLLAALALAACQPLTAAQPLETEPTAAPTAAEMTPTHVPQASEPQPAPTDPALTSIDAVPSPAQPTAEPLRFTFPTPGEAPVSAWRPALYQAPWALGRYDHFFFSRPIAVDEINWPLADYRYGGTFFSADIVHTGIDIDARKGTPVIAAANGTVIWAGYGLFYGTHNEDDPYGLAVTVRHDFGWNGQRLYTIYAHMDRIDVVVGQDVAQAEQLGLVGETGNTTGPHLHFEVRIKNNNFFTTLNPELWLAPPQGWGVLVGRLENTNGSLLESQDVTVRSLDSGRKWIVRSYGPKIINRDPYYRENLVLSDLPAGKYEILIDYLEDRYRQEVSVQAGAITYFSFYGDDGFDTAPPPDPEGEAWLETTTLPAPP